MTGRSVARSLAVTNAASITATQWRPGPFRPQPTDASVAAPATHKRVPTAVLREPGAVTRPPSHSGSGLFSSGRSATNAAATRPAMIDSCRTLSATKSCTARVVSRIAEVVEDEVHPKQQRDMPQVQRHRSGVADHGQPPHPWAPCPPGDRRRGGNRERAHHDCVAGQQATTAVSCSSAAGSRCRRG